MKRALLVVLFSTLTTPSIAMPTHPDADPAFGCSNARDTARGTPALFIQPGMGGATIGILSATSGPKAAKADQQFGYLQNTVQAGHTEVWLMTCVSPGDPVIGLDPALAHPAMLAVLDRMNSIGVTRVFVSGMNDYTNPCELVGGQAGLNLSWDLTVTAATYQGPMTVTVFNRADIPTLGSEHVQDDGCHMTPQGAQLAGGAVAGLIAAARQ